MYTYDTETSDNGTEAWVWSWALCDEQYNVEVGNGLDVMRLFRILPHKSEVWVHNLNFDGEFIFWELIRAGYKLAYDLNPRDRQHGVFNVLADDNGIISMEVWTLGRRVIFRDSLRIFRCKLEKLPKMCGFETEAVKEVMDYVERRERGHVKTDAELSYQVQDVKVLMHAMKWVRTYAAKGNTVGAIAVNEFKKTLNNKAPFKGLTLDERFALRSLYSGGVVYCPPERCGVRVDVVGRTYDRNSMYPAEAVRDLPVAIRERYDGLQACAGVCAYHVQARRLKLKRDGFPLIITPFTGAGRSEIPLIDKWLYKDEYDRVRHYYDGEDWHVVSTVEFDTAPICREFVNKWYTIKRTEPERRTYAKFVLNNLTGKFGENAIHEQLRRKVEGDDYVQYRYNEIDEGVNNWRFMPAVAYITSCSRLALADAAERAGLHNLLYTDTDSIHTTGWLPEDMIHDTRLGAWTGEDTFDSAVYIKPKSYAEALDSKTVSCHHAGLNNDATVAAWDEHGEVYDTGELIDFSNMIPGQLFFTNMSKRVKGGVLIERKPKVL